MEISFQHTNSSASHDSTLLTVSPRDSGAQRYLIDAGESVSPSAFIGPDESLDGVFLTHAHNDHYASLGHALSSSETPLFTSPPTATILEQVYIEADRYQDLGNVDAVTDALRPIESWTQLADGVFVLPIPAGHTPGATAFLFRIDDLEYNDETVTVLATGDFTTRPVAGYPGLTIPDPIDIDILIANAATSTDFQENLSGAVEVILERALSGATTLVAASALTSIHVAYVLGHLAAQLDRRLPIHLVGQAAKHYTALDYDIPSVTTIAQFDHTDEVLAPGAVTIAGPEAPTQGSTGRLFGVVEDDSDAAFIQLTTSSPEIVDGAACATHEFEVSNHPTKQQFLDFVDENLPRHLVFKHVSPTTSKDLSSSLDNLFHWENDDLNAHVLYDDGSWVSPHWVTESSANLIRQKNYRESGARIPIDRPIGELPSVSWDRQSAMVDAEGVAVERLVEKFEATQPQQTTQQERAASDGGQMAGATAEGDAAGDDADAESAGSGGDQRSRIDVEFQSEVRERLDALESALDDAVSNESTVEAVETGFESVGARLDEVETRLANLPEQVAHAEYETVTGTIIQQNELVLVRLDPDEVDDLDQPLAHGTDVEISVQSTDPAEER